MATLIIGKDLQETVKQERVQISLIGMCPILVVDIKLFKPKNPHQPIMLQTVGECITIILGEVLLPTAEYQDMYSVWQQMQMYFREEHQNHQSII